jgi:hypothetical protein
VVAIEPDERVVVDDAAGLEFVDPDVAAAQLDALGAADVAVDFLDGASPQFGGFVVEHDLGVVVVAV